MTPSLGRVLLIVGILIIIAAVFMHYKLAALIFPHFNIVVAVVGLVIAAIGLFGMLSRSRAA